MWDVELRVKYIFWFIKKKKSIFLIYSDNANHIFLKSIFWKLNLGLSEEMYLEGY